MRFHVTHVSLDRLGAGKAGWESVHLGVAPGVSLDLSAIRVASVSYTGVKMSFLTRIRYDTMCVGCGPHSGLLWWQDAGDDDDEDDDIIPGRQGNGYGSSRWPAVGRDGETVGGQVW